jgi:hypothetical protein
VIIRIAILILGTMALSCNDQSARESQQPKQSHEGSLQPKAASETAPSAAAPAAASTPTSPASVGDGKYPVKWSNASALELKSATDARARYLHAEPEMFGELEGEGSKVRPGNCAQWAEFHAEGFEPSSGVEETPDSGAKLRCSTLKLIETGKSAQRSHVRALGWDRTMLSILPVEVATAVHSDDEQAIAAARNAGKSLLQFDPKARVKPNPDQETLEVTAGDRQTMIVMYPMAWGDFDSDGTDDMAMAVINGATRGSLAYTRLLIVTRHSPNAPLVVIEAR